jgi:opacity protein-like surface antigen
VGAGVETELWAGWKGRIEYRYTDFGSQTKTVPLTTACTVCPSPSSSASIALRESFHTLRALDWDLISDGAWRGVTAVL